MKTAEVWDIARMIEREFGYTHSVAYLAAIKTYSDPYGIAEKSFGTNAAEKLTEWRNQLVEYWGK